MRHNFLDRYGHVDSQLHRLNRADTLYLTKFLWKA